MDKLRKIGYVISLKRIVQILVLVDLIVFLVFLGFMSGTGKSFEQADGVTEEIVQLGNRVYTLKKSLYELSDRARQFVVTHEEDVRDAYIDEFGSLQKKTDDLVEMSSHFQKEDVLYHLLTVQKLSDQLVREQWYAIALVSEEMGTANAVLPLSDRVKIDSRDAARSPMEKQAEAERRIFNADYTNLLVQVNEQIEAYKTVLTENIRQKQSASTLYFSRRIREYRLLILLAAAILFITLGLLAALIIWPVYSLIGEIHYGMPASRKGVYELQFLASNYNHFLEQMGNVRLRLSHEASHDSLTGLYNRGAYNEYMQLYKKRPIALMLIDVDHFKTINDTYGHEIGDKVLIRVSEVLQREFRETDAVCRLGGDEFAVIIVQVNKSAQNAIGAKIVNVARTLEVSEEGLPKISISVGVAFSEQVESIEDLFLAADHALYRIKKSGRNGYGFYMGT